MADADAARAVPWAISEKAASVHGELGPNPWAPPWTSTRDVAWKNVAAETELSLTARESNAVFEQNGLSQNGLSHNGKRSRRWCSCVEEHACRRTVLLFGAAFEFQLVSRLRPRTALICRGHPPAARARQNFAASCDSALLRPRDGGPQSILPLFPYSIHHS